METMKTLTVRVESLADVRRAVLAAAVRPERTAGLSFPTYELMHRIFAPKRLEIVRAMAGQGPLSIREVSRRVGRDFKGVHADVTALVKAGVLDRTAEGVIFPYDRLHFEFDIDAAA